MPPGWIDDQFNRAYIFTFTGGAGRSAYDPPTKPNGTPPASSNVGGLDAYLIPAVPVFGPVPSDGSWHPPMAPYSVSWHGPAMSAEWRNFLETSMACAPACNMIIADILATAPVAKSTLGPTNYGYPYSLGSEDLNAMFTDINNPRWELASSMPLDVLAKAIDRKAERLQNAWAALELLVDRAAFPDGTKEYQYALVVDRDGNYPDVRYGYVKMKALDVWKYGTSMDPESRYTKSYLQSLGVTMVIESQGTRIQVLVQEKVQLIRYYLYYGELPPGNKIFK